MKLDENPQMVAMLDHAKGSLENKIRQAYNSGYNDGFKAGVFEAWDDMRKQLNKSLRQQIEQTEPQTIAKDINRRVEMDKKEWSARHIEDEPYDYCKNRNCVWWSRTLRICLAERNGLVCKYKSGKE